MTHDIEQDAPALSPTRRTVLTGAAWTLPVIAAATITPMAAASNAPVLAFDKSTYNGTACGTITGAYVTVTVNNVATAGKSVTTTLSGGYKFSDGTTTNTQVSGSDGRVNLPAISVPATGGSGTSSATASGAVTIVASLSAPPTTSAHRYTFNADSQTAGNNAVANIPAGSTPTGGWGFLAPNGDLYFSFNNGTPNNAYKIASGVAKAVGGYAPNPDAYAIEYTTTAGGAYRYTFNADSQTAGNNAVANIPAGSTPTGGWGFLAPNGDLYFSFNNGTPNNAYKIASGVAKAVGGYAPNPDAYAIEYTTTAGGAYRYTFNADSQTAGNNAVANIPAGSTPTGGWGFLAPNGDLYFSFNNGTPNNAYKIASGVAKAVGGYAPNPDAYAIEYTTAPAC